MNRFINLGFGKVTISGEKRSGIFTGRKIKYRHSRLPRLSFVSQTGFTLLEALMYSALFSLFVTSVLTGAYALATSASRLQVQTHVQAEGNFLLAKLAWAAAGAGVVTVSQNPPTVVLRSNNGTLTLQASGTNIQLQNNGDNFADLASGDVTVNSVHFDTVLIASSTNQFGLQTTFNMSAVSSYGNRYSQSFSSLNFLEP